MTWDPSSVWCLFLLAGVPLLAWRLWRRRGEAVAFSSTAVAASVRPTWRMRLRWLPTALRLLAIALIIVALARPQQDNQETKITSEGIAIEMLVDRSGSMQAMDFQLDGQSVDRLTAVKDVAGRFVEGDPDSGLKGRPADLIGLVRFARQADNVSPLTLDHDYLLHQLDATHIAATQEEDGTAIGDAVGLAVERLTSLQRRKNKDGQDAVQSKVLILLTDGENNAGDLDPLEAAELAKAEGVRIYTIGVGTRGRAPVPVTDPFTGERRYRYVEVSIDEDTLRKMAQTADGAYFRATDTQSLKDIYAKIDKLEKTKIQQHTVGDIRELAVQPTEWGGWTLPSLAMMAVGLVAVESALSGLVFRRLV